MQGPSKTEVYLFYNNMVGLLKALEGKYTLVDLRNEACVTGKIIYVDGYMNVEMEDCIFYNPRGATYPFASFFVKGRNIRYVHIPKGLSAVDLLENHLKGLRREKPKKKMTFKVKRAQRYQSEIVQGLQSN